MLHPDSSPGQTSALSPQMLCCNFAADTGTASHGMDSSRHPWDAGYHTIVGSRIARRFRQMDGSFFLHVALLYILYTQRSVYCAIASVSMELKYL